MKHLLLLFLAVATLSPAIADSEKKNVLIILYDDLRTELGCYGAGHAVTPHIDSIAERGLVFERAYCQKAVCWPSRNSFFSGIQPDNLGKTDSDNTFRISHPEVVSLPQLFRTNGWYTRGFGKILHDGQTDLASWSEPQYFAPPKHYAAEGFENHHPIINQSSPENRKNPLFEGPDVPDDAYEDGLMATTAANAILEAAKEEAPFFFMVGFHKPHTPFNAPKKYWDLYDAEEIPLSPFPDLPIGSPVEFATSGWPYVRSFSGMPESGPMPDDLARQVRHAYLACTSYVDALTGQLIEALEKSGVREQTLILLWSDHGYHLGDQEMWSKHNNFELSTRVPLVASGPGVSKGRTRATVELLDILPTLADWAGLETPDHAEGRSFFPVFSDPETFHRNAALSQFSRKGATGYSIRSTNYRYTVWRSKKDNRILARELYDLKKSPVETRNLADSPEYGAILRLHRDLLAKRCESAR